MSAARTERYGLNDDQEQAYDSLTSGERKAFRSAMRSGDDLTPLEIAVYNRVMQAGDDRATGKTGPTTVAELEYRRHMYSGDY